MTAILRALAVAAPTAATILIEMTLILLVAILIQRLLKRLPAIRHSVLFWALIAVGLCPAIAISVRHSHISIQVPLYDWAVPVALDHSQTAPAIVRKSLERWPSSSELTLPSFLILVWVIGALVGVIRLTRGWRSISRIQRAALPSSDIRVARARDQIAAVFDVSAPVVLSSERVCIPLAVGCWRPRVLVPNSLLSSLNEAEILQVLAHEYAHVFRHDTVTNLYQRFLAAVLWFHPFVHIANRLLDTTREEICDNYVLRVAEPVDYSKTLLAVAESVGSPDALLAPSLLRSWVSLEQRIARLLDPERCVMTNSKAITAAGIAALFLGVTLAISTMAVPPAPQQDQSKSTSLSHIVKLGTPQKTDDQGDTITVESIRGTSDTIRTGNTYEVSGTYTLASRDKAELAISVTEGNQAKPILVRDESGRPYELIPVNLSGHHAPIPGQTEVVSKGSGHFTLRFHMWGPGEPHVSFYPIKSSGESFLSTYF